MQTIDINSIITTNEYLRLDTNVDKLKKSIETVGLINPLVLNQNNELIAGGRRYSAMKELGMQMVPVVFVEKTELEQELISIDENLVRKDLKNTELEKSLARGKEIYESLYPEAEKFDEEDLTLPENQEIKTELPNDKRSFIDITSEKTGLSKKVIKSAIERETKSSPKVKELRATGELNASQTNEIIKLNENDQEQVADLIKEKSAKEVKELVKNVKEHGLQTAVNEFVNGPQMPKEFKSLDTLIKRTNKVLGKILLEEMKSEHDDVKKILDSISTLRVSLDQFLVLCTSDVEAIDTEENLTSEKLDDYNYQEVVQDAMEDFGSQTSSEL